MIALIDNRPIKESKGKSLAAESCKARLLPGITIPILLPDEMADTFFDVVVTCNGYRDRRQFVSRLTQTLPKLAADPDIGVLARICGMSVKDLVRFHTLTPFKRAFVLAKCARFPHGTNIGGHLRYSAMNPKSDHLYMCKACADEDIAFWGRSYWRRSHQTPGIEWCDKHELPLYACQRTRIQSEPYFSLSTATMITDFSYPTSGVTRRYIEIASFIATQTEPIPVSVLQSVVRAALRGKGLRSSEKGQRPLLSDSALECAPQEWLARLIPGITRKKPLRYFASIDNAARGAGPMQAGAILALAILFENPDQCANLLRSKVAEAGEAESTSRSRKLPNGYWMSQEPLNLYLKHRADVTKISHELGLDRSYVARMLKSIGLPSWNLIRNQSTRKALLEFMNGGKIETVVLRHSRNMETFQELLRMNLYAIRPLLQ